MKDLDLISIIVPVYNVENYLVNCLNSIINQSYQNLEIIIVDDGSTDKCKDICDEYALKDSRIIVVHQENQGLGPARNTGMSIAKGNYISFVDSDDYIHPRAIELLYESIKTKNLALSMARYIKVYGYSEFSLINEVESYNITQEELIKCFYGVETSNNILHNVNAISVWNKLYKRDLLDEISFRSMYHEDVDFSMAIILKIKEAVFINIPLYAWMQRSSSITYEPMNKKKLEVLSAYKYSIARIPKSEEIYRGYAILRMYKFMLSTRHLSAHSACANYANQLIKTLNQEFHKEFISNKNISIKDKIEIYVMYAVPSLYALFIKLCESLSKYKFI